MGKLSALVLLFLLSLGQLVFAEQALRSGSMKIFAVTNDGEGLSADLTLDLVPGTGKIWTSVHPLVGTTTQSAEKTALEVAKRFSSEWNKYDYKFSIGSSAAMVEGPSAGAAMAFLTIALLQDKKVPADVSITGTISEDGIVGTVGGVFEKSKAAKEAGMRLFMIPSGEARRIEKLESGVESINLIEYAKEKWGIYVIEVATMDDLMKYAYSDLSQIDIKKLAAEEPPEFVPKPTAPREELAPLKDITRRHLKETKQLLKDARTALSATLIEDLSIIGRMVGSLNNAEKNVKTAEILLDQGYLYSAANFSFLARVNGMLIKDIAENPSLLSSDATVFDLKIDLLKQDVAGLKQQFSEFMPVDRLEWLISAQQRLGWAEATLDELSHSQTVVVSGSGSSDDQKSAVIDSLYKYESARAWITVAQEFFEAAKAARQKVKPLTDFSEKAQDVLVRAENGLSVFKGEDTEDIERRLASAKEEIKRGWTLAALYNASSAQALIDGKLQSDQADVNKLELTLRKRIEALTGNVSKSKYKHVWANLYLDHARYYLEQSLYYKGLNHKSDAVSALKNGLSLQVLAESMYKVTEEVQDYYSANQPQPFEAGQETQQPEPVKTDQLKWYLLFFLLPTVLFIVLLVFLLKILKARKVDAKYSVYEEIKSLKQSQRELEDKLSHGQVSEAEYLSESSHLAEQMRRLMRMREAKTEASFASDKFRADLLLFDMKTRDLRRGLKQGAIARDDFMRLANEYNAKVKQLYDTLAEQASFGEDEKPEREAPVDSDLEEVQRSVRRQVKAAPRRKWATKK